MLFCSKQTSKQVYYATSAGPDALEWAGEYSAAKSYTKVNKWGVEIGCFEAVYRDLL